MGDRAGAQASTDRPRRASSLPPDERRAGIVSATLPLLLERGAAVTTKQIADAAGIAEGTIFRVFPDKDALLRAVVDSVFDTRPLEEELGAIDRRQPFERQLAEAVALIQRRITEVWRLVSAVGDSTLLRHRQKTPPRELKALAELFEPHCRRLRTEPAEAARALRALTLAGSHPAIYDKPMSPEEVVALLLDGIRVRSSRFRTASDQGAPC